MLKYLLCNPRNDAQVVETVSTEILSFASMLDDYENLINEILNSPVFVLA